MVDTALIIARAGLAKKHIERAAATITEKMVKAVGFRNLLVHECSKIDLKNVYQIAACYVEDLLEYFAAIFSKLDIKS